MSDNSQNWPPLPAKNLNVKEMAERLQLSRSRFDELVAAGVFVAPARDPRSRRPYFPPEAVRQNLDIRATGMGVNGQPVLFYSPRKPTLSRGRPAARLARRPEARGDGRVAELAADLSALDLGSVTVAEVEAAVRALQGGGVSEPDTRAVYRQIKCRRASGS